MSILYQELVDTLTKTADLYHRQAPDLLAVTKNQPVTKILPLLQLGHRLFGENRVQEAEEKWTNLKPIYPDINLHLIGPLQTNKVKQALALFDVIETLDRPRLAEKLAEHKVHNRNVKLLIQINTGNEPQKSGVSLADFPSFYRLCLEELFLPVIGLMCIPPLREDPLPHFQTLARLAQEYQLPSLSMGMSQDFPQAIACGTSWVRIGSALFGKR